MRQGQQHRRGRTRGGQNNNHGNNNNNNRKGQNPISRTYQSNGPDGKVSGTASGIAEKYLSLARDATTSGDPVLAENYLQHAEHYNRIILAYRESQAQGGEDGGPRRTGAAGEANDQNDDNGDDEGESFGRDMQPLPPVDLPPRQPEQAPRFNDQPRPDNQQRFEDRPPRFNNDQQRRNNNNQPRDRYQGGGDRERERFNNGDRNDRFNNQPRDRFNNDRNQGGGQPFGDRPPREGGFDRHGGGQGGDRPFRDNNQPRPDRNNDHNRPDHNRPDRDRPDRFEGRAEFRPEARHESRQEFRPQVRPPAAPELRAADQPDIRPEPVRAHEPRADVPVREPLRVEPPFAAELPLSSVQPPMPRSDVPRAPRAPRRERAPVVVAEHEQPEFLRRPVRRPRRDAAVAAEEAAAAPAATAKPAPDREPGQD